MGLKRYTDARESYERALKLDEDNDQIKASLKEAAERGTEHQVGNDCLPQTRRGRKKSAWARGRK